MNLKRIRAAAPDRNRERIKSLSRWVDDAPTTSGIRKAKLPTLHWDTELRGFGVLRRLSPSCIVVLIRERLLAETPRAP